MEMIEVFIALKQFLPDHHVSVRTDIKSVVSYINHKGVSAFVSTMQTGAPDSDCIRMLKQTSCRDRG